MIKKEENKLAYGTGYDATIIEENEKYFIAHIEYLLDDNALPWYIMGEKEYKGAGIYFYKETKSDDNFSFISYQYYTLLAEQAFKRYEQSLNEPKGQIECYHCNSIESYDTLKGEVIAIRKNVLDYGFQTSPYQLYYVISGSGCTEKSRGTSLSAINLYHNEKHQIERANVLGVVEAKKLPFWAKDKLERIIKAEEVKRKLQRDRSER